MHINEIYKSSTYSKMELVQYEGNKSFKDYVLDKERMKNGLFYHKLIIFKLF